MGGGGLGKYPWKPPLSGPGHEYTDIIYVRIEAKHLYTIAL